MDRWIHPDVSNDPLSSRSRRGWGRRAGNAKVSSGVTTWLGAVGGKCEGMFGVATGPGCGGREMRRAGTVRNDKEILIFPNGPLFYRPGLGAWSFPMNSWAAGVPAGAEWVQPRKWRSRGRRRVRAGRWRGCRVFRAGWRRSRPGRGSRAGRGGGRRGSGQAERAVMRAARPSRMRSMPKSRALSRPAGGGDSEKAARTCG
jgi:hypothetical protein